LRHSAIVKYTTESDPTTAEFTSRQYKHGFDPLGLGLTVQALGLCISGRHTIGPSSKTIPSSTIQL